MTEFEQYLNSQVPYDDEHAWAVEATITLQALISNLSIEMDDFALAALMVLHRRAPEDTVRDADARVDEEIDKIIVQTDQYQEGLQEINDFIEDLENGE